MPEEPQQNNSTTDVEPVKKVSAGKSEIHVIPDQFYGAALKTKLQEVNKGEEPNTTNSSAKKSSLPIIIGIVIFLVILLAGGYFVYINKDVLFAPKTPVEPVVVTEPVEPPPVVVIPPPSAPSNLQATSTSPRSVTITWTDTSDNEAAFRIERRPESQTIFQRITDLPPNSTTFQDNSVQASSTYYYRIISRNDSGESEGGNEVMAITQALPPPPPEQEPLPPAGLDSDSDGISDLEEAIFAADPRNPDTDGDGFLDGNEVFNLYNPNGRAPAKLAESGLLKTVDASLGWSFMIPKAWQYTLDLPDGSAATVVTGHGERFVVSIKQNKEKTPVIDWYLANFPEVEKSRLLLYKSKGGYSGIIGPDLLTTYIPWDDVIYVFTYDMQDQPFINYRTLYSMILNSLVLSGLDQKVVPAGTGQLPFEPAANAVGESTQPISVEQATSSQAEQMPEVFPSSESATPEATSTENQ
ncbi:fibronectin type III domain-containing protein [Patescibacteria group bacterium]|nr:fibronectin type III domain-containing protein [Patescibacteria group bacterium]